MITQWYWTSCVLKMFFLWHLTWKWCSSVCCGCVHDLNYGYSSLPFVFHRAVAMWQNWWFVHSLCFMCFKMPIVPFAECLGSLFQEFLSSGDHIWIWRSCAWFIFSFLIQSYIVVILLIIWIGIPAAIPKFLIHYVQLNLGDIFVISQYDTSLVLM